MTTLTYNELAVLGAIDASEYGENLLDAVWTFTINDHCDLVARSIPGTVSSLVKKGLLRSGGSGNEATIQMTEAGADAYLANTTKNRKSK